MDILVISGLSGAGKSRAAAVLEDLDFYCVDNMPVMLIPKFADLCVATRGRYDRVALVTDIRGGDSFDELFFVLDELGKQGHEYKILYMDASLETIVKRYKETRRRHPLDTSDSSLEEAIYREMEILKPVKKRADYIIDTSGLTLSRLHRTLSQIFAPSDEEALSITVMSFGYKYGIPMEADIVFDVRFLPNPFYITDLRDKSGLDDAVFDYVFSTKGAREFIYRFEEMMEFLLPNYEEEGKRSITIAIGCTGGRHRSVSVTRALSEYFAQTGHSVECSHRDINKV